MIIMRYLNTNIAIHSAIDGTKKIHFHMDKVKTDDFGIDIEIEPQ